jgi:hypothetical protein
MPIVRSFLILSLILLQIFATGNSFAQTSSSEAENCEMVVTVDTPLSQIVPRCLADRPSLTTPEELITNDLAVCRCIETSQPIFRPTAESISSQKDLQARLAKINRYSESFASSRALNVLSHSRNARDAEIGLMSNLGETRTSTRKILNPNQSSQRPNRTASAIADLSPEQRARIENGPAISTSISKVNSIDPADADSQCVTYMEYSAQRELPYDNAFFLFLKSATFQEEDWDADRLKTRYDSAPAEDKPAILARMIFLSRNPQFSAMFRAQPTRDFSRALITRKKNELFTLIKQLAPADENCAAQANGCWRQAQTSGKYQQFTQGSQQFLQNNDVTDIVSTQTASDYTTELQRILAAGSADENIPRTPEGYFSYLQSTNRELAFTCSGPRASAQCIDRFSDHCGSITRLHKRITSGIKRSGNDIQEELDAEMLLHGSMNPRQNMSFDAFNDLMCRRNYRNSEGTEMNFFAFRSRMCPGTNNAPECSDRRALLQRFNSEYAGGGSEADGNIRGGFGVAITRREFTTVSVAQVEAFNRITESPRELRARFNGGYPTINSRGQLVPFVPSSATSASRTPASRASDTTAGADLRPNQASGAAAIPQQAEAESPRQSSRSSRESEPEEIRQPENRNQQRSLPTFPGSLTDRRRETNQQPVLQPEAAPNAQPFRENSRESDRSAGAEAPDRIIGSPAGANATSPSQSSGGVTSSSASEASAVLSRPEVEVPVRRARRGDTRFNRRALLNGKYADESKEDATPSKLESQPPVSVNVDPEILRSLVEDISILNTSPEVLATVNASSDDVVKLELYSGEDKATVYALRQNGNISFSLTPPASSGGRSPASLGENEMNVRLKPDLYRLISTNPSALNNYPEVVGPAMQLPGDIVRMNVVAPDSTPLTIYVDKRGSTLRFTTNDQNIIQAYRP